MRSASAERIFSYIVNIYFKIHFKISAVIICVVRNWSLSEFFKLTIELMATGRIFLP